MQRGCQHLIITSNRCMAAPAILRDQRDDAQEDQAGLVIYHVLGLAE